MEKFLVTKNRELFDEQIGMGFRIFRTTVLHKTLKEVGGQSLVASLSNFETGKLFRYDYMFYYIVACQNEEQLQRLEGLVSAVMKAAWNRGQRYDKKN